MSKNSKTLQVNTARQFAFLQRLSMAHERAARSFANLDEALICTEPIAGGWTIKDMLGHVVTWNDEFRKAIRATLRRDNVTEREVDWNEWNEMKIAEKRNWTFERIRNDLNRDYTEAVELITSLRPHEFRIFGVNDWACSPPKEMTKVLHRQVESVETLIMYHWRHMNQHSRMIEKWREKKGL